MKETNRITQAFDFLYKHAQEAKPFTIDELSAVTEKVSVFTKQFAYALFGDDRAKFV